MFLTWLKHRSAAVVRAFLAIGLLSSSILPPVVSWGQPTAGAVVPAQVAQQRADAAVPISPSDAAAAPGGQAAWNELPAAKLSETKAAASQPSSDPSGLPEIVDRRTAQGAVFSAGDDRYVALLSSEPLHYRDADGNWQPIDPSFRALEDSYVVERNLVRGRAGARQAWLSAAVDQVALFWQATRVGVVDGAGVFTELARALDAPSGFAQTGAAGNVLYYTNTWTDPLLSEEIHSSPGSLEQALVFAGPPRLIARAEFLEMQASLRLLPDMTLWADGKPVSGELQAADTLEVRDEKGEQALILAPVRAFEQSHPDVAVAGAYAVYQTDTPGAWRVGVRMPWDWWTDPGRTYPVVLDPVITVQRSTGWGEGLAWVRSTGDKAYTLGDMRLGAYLPDYNTQSRGYVQFNSLPALLNNASVPVLVTAAYLDVEPTDFWFPTYEYHGSGFTDWDSVPNKRKVTLAYAGACPNDAGCNGFSLQDGRLTDPNNYNWDNQPVGIDIGTETLKVGPMKKSGNANPTVTTWDVTAQIQSWYTAWSNQPNPRPGPTFQLRAVDDNGIDATCPKPGPYYSGFANGKFLTDSNLVPRCTNFYIPPGKVSLRIEYTELELPFTSGNPLQPPLLNTPGVPSYTPLTGSSDNLFVSPNHRYKLTKPTGLAHWRAVALRGNHAYDEVLPARAMLKLLDFSAVTGPDDEPVQMLSPKAQGADQTTFFLIDDHLTGSTLPYADLRVEVVASADNDYAADQQRNYRLDYARALPMAALNYGVFNNRNFTMFSDRLLEMGEFHLDQGDNVGFIATVSAALEIMVVAPATDAPDEGALMSANHPSVNPFVAAQPGGTMRTFSFSAPVTGEYLLVLVNKERPVFDPDRGFATALTASVSILPCPSGSYPTAQYLCQPLILPDGLTPAPRSVAIPGGGTLTVYSEGDFTPGADWCTQNEVVGAPIIDAGVPGRWAVVVQGRVCYQGGVLTTSPDSAVGLIVTNPAPDPGDGRWHGRIPPIPIYGNEMLVPAPGEPDGELTLVAGGLLQPNADTIRRIRPFEQYWAGSYVHHGDSISTAAMQAQGLDTLSAQVVVDAAGTVFPISWSTDWALFPDACPTCPVEWTFVDDPAAPSAALPLQLDLASATLRLLNAGLLDGEVRELDSYQKAGGPTAFQLRNATSRLTLGPLLGGTTKPVHVVIQPPGWARAAEGEGGCEQGGAPASCLDLRRGEYQWLPLADAEQNVSPWSLPDMHIETAPATLIFSREGRLNIFSADHPASTDDFGQTFSFDTWEAGVRVVQEKCVDTDPVETTVIRGTALIALPTLGDDGSGPASSWAKADFKLCETSLQQAHIQFGIPKPGIPVGSTGVGVHLLDGTVTIDPNTGDTRISLGVGFQTLDGFTLTSGKGTVTIDTAGMLSLQATGTLVGVVSADELRLDVAWNPLDMLFEGQVSYGGGLLSGEVMMHGWVGQGWQGKYAWLPPNDEFHFTGSIGGTVKLKSGAVVDEWPFVLPPFTLSLSAQIAFGEFCTASACSSYDWGMSATVKVLGYKVGVYADGGSPELILGSDNHKLIDQAGASALALPLVPDAAPPPPPISYPGANQVDLSPSFASPFDGDVPDQAGLVCSGVGTAVVECPFLVNGGVGRALFIATWENGDLEVSLVKPNGVVITPANAQANGAVYATEPPGLVQVASYSVITPTTGPALDPGTWKVRLGNVGAGLLPGLKNNYTLLFSADKPAATLVWGPPQDLSPTLRRLPWTASRGGQPLNPDLEVELFAIDAAQQPVTPTLMAGATIVQKISAGAGQYDWDLSGLAAGTYAFGARLDDHATGNGHVVVWSPYTISLVDTTPPPIPVVIGSLAFVDTLLVFWTRDDVTPDLAGYLVEYTVPEWDLTTPLPQVRRVLPTKKSVSPLVERARLGGLFLSGPQPISTNVCVRSYDATGNVSDCFPTPIDMPEFPEVRLGPPEDLTVNSDGAGIMVNWVPPGARVPPGTLLDYGPAGCLLPGASRNAAEGPSPLIFPSDATSALLTGLTPGQVYEIGLRGYRDPGEIGPRISARVMHIDPTDANADGIPDQWAALYGLDPDIADLDGDGLPDVSEFQAASNPRRADSDGDGAYDGQEVEAGSDPCDPDSRPPVELPRLALVGEAALHFATAANLSGPEPQAISILNAGGGALDWEARASASWILLDQSAGRGIGALTIRVSPAGLGPGLYSGSLVITNVSLRSVQAALPESVTIPVTMLVLPPKEHKVFIPLVARSLP